MKHLMTLIALVVAVTAGAQNNLGNCIECPYNPDFDHDYFVGTEDLMGFLASFGSQFNNPPEPCDYDGTPLEELMAGITNGDIILDSIFIEYEVSDVSTYFEIGCPDPVTDTIVLSNTAMLTGFYQAAAKWYMQGPDDYGSQVRFTFEWALGEGLYKFGCKSWGLESYTNEGFFGNYNSATEWTAIPFPDSWFMDENGIDLDDWSESQGWVAYTNYLHILPYWHYAE